MKRIIHTLLTILIPAYVLAWNVPDETLRYSVRFKWGLIDANVGIATITTSNNPASGNFSATLSGKSVNLFGHYYEASDTITGSIMTNGMSLDSDETLYREGGRFAIETITGNAQGPSKAGPIIEHLSDGKVIRSRVSNYGSGLTIDLLAVFYYMRQIDYGSYSPGQAFHINMSDGNSIESLNISYIGTENISADGNTHETYHISLSFSVQGSSKTDNMNVWIATDNTRIPLLINGNLSVGSMECRFIGEGTIRQLNGF